MCLKQRPLANFEAAFVFLIHASAECQTRRRTRLIDDLQRVDARGEVSMVRVLENETAIIKDGSG